VELETGMDIISWCLDIIQKLKEHPDSLMTIIDNIKSLSDEEQVSVLAFLLGGAVGREYKSEDNA
jgi:hypothetical protein